MKFLKDNIVSILMIVVAVVVTVLVMNTFSKSKPPIDNTELIKEVRAQRDYFRAAYDSVISRSEERDTVLITEYKTLYEKNKTIRPAVTSLDKQGTGAELDRYIMQAGSGN